jgi:predicted protein tyrosine phosphatase
MGEGSRGPTSFSSWRAHRARLQKRFRKSLKSARVVCLDIPDYAFMQPELVALLEKKVGPFLK